MINLMNFRIKNSSTYYYRIWLIKAQLKKLKKKIHKIIQNLYNL